MKSYQYEKKIIDSYELFIKNVRGLHETINVLNVLSCYIESTTNLLTDIYNDSDISFNDYCYLSELINNKFKESCRVVKNS